ncbi:MAG: hypothetical protein KDA85_21775 [Planctomycetaceae bacterium]|nr:hypothetical protein [Planctomycetaceae bacterium]
MRSVTQEPLSVAASSAVVVAPVEGEVSRRPDAWGFSPLTYREVRRRFWHMVPGVLGFVLHVVPHRDPISATLEVIFAGVCAVVGLRILLGFRQIQRQGEANGRTAVGGYVLSVLLTVLLFPRHLELGLSVLAILAFGDGSATLFGLMFRGPRLWWNRAKSWSGFLAFNLVGTLMAAWMYWGETLNPEAADPAVTFVQAVGLVGPAVFAAALAESMRSRINDNIRVGVTSAVALALLHLLRPMA